LNPRLRLFVAAELPEPVVDALVRWRPRDDALRPVAADALHVTLAFLGERAEGEVEALSRVVAHAARPVGGLSLAGAVWLPRPRAPRVLAVEVRDADGALAALQADVARGIEEVSDWRREKRPFLAHVTVGRVRPRGRPGLDMGAPPDAGTFAAAALTLFRSRLHPHGARYEPVARAMLVEP
jgi:RNA 2',3'-cyclic 3'-phosphodiesterase